MPGFGDIFQKALYLGVGLASVASETAATKLSELRNQARKVADDLVARGEMTTEQAQKFVDDLIQQAQSIPPESTVDVAQGPAQPRPIEIQIEEDGEGAAAGEHVDQLRNQVQDLQAELQRLQREP